MMQEQSPAPLAGLKVLVIEDEYFLADEISRALRRSGAAVVGPFSDLADGRVGIETNPDLAGAVLDVNLDGTLVFPIADVLRDRGVPFVFTTGYDDGAMPVAYRDVPRCEKPVNVNEAIGKLVQCRAQAAPPPGGSAV